MEDDQEQTVHSDVSASRGPKSLICTAKGSVLEAIKNISMWPIHNSACAMPSFSDLTSPGIEGGHMIRMSTAFVVNVDPSLASPPRSGLALLAFLLAVFQGELCI